MKTTLLSTSLCAIALSAGAQDLNNPADQINRATNYNLTVVGHSYNVPIYIGAINMSSQYGSEGHMTNLLMGFDGYTNTIQVGTNFYHIKDGKIVPVVPEVPYNIQYGWPTNFVIPTNWNQHLTNPCYPYYVVDGDEEVSKYYITNANGVTVDVHTYRDWGDCDYAGTSLLTKQMEKLGLIHTNSPSPLRITSTIVVTNSEKAYVEYVGPWSFDIKVHDGHDFLQTNYTIGTDQIPDLETLSHRGPNISTNPFSGVIPL